MAKDQKKYRERVNLLDKKVVQIDELLMYLAANRDLVSSALKYSDMTTKGTQALKISKGLESPEIIESLLTRLSDGFTQMQTPEHPGLLDICLDYKYGPLKFFGDDVRDPKTGEIQAATRTFPDGTKPKANELGLIFHLTYLLRYFTSKSVEPDCHVKFKKDGELVDIGSMLTSGKPHTGIVTELFNATFPKRSETATEISIKKRIAHLTAKKISKEKIVRDPTKGFKEGDPHLDLIAKEINSKLGTDDSGADILNFLNCVRDGKVKIPMSSRVEFIGWTLDPPKELVEMASACVHPQTKSKFHQ